MTDVKLLAHRGSNPYADHSMAAYEAAINWGADFIEPDLYLTKDGILVASHDDHAFSTKTYAEALAENPALVRFDQVIDLVNQRSAETGREIGITLETKTTDYATSEAVIKMLVAKGFTDPDRVYINSFGASNLQSLHDTIMPQYGVDIPLLLLVSGTYNLAQIATYADGIAPSTTILTKSLVDQAHALGLEVHTWTFNGTAAQMEALVATGVDAIYCDATDAARAMIDQINGVKTAIGSGAAETIAGTASSDKVFAMQGDDFVRAGAGNDIVYGDAGNDILLGGAGNDQLVGGGGSDFLLGEDGSDVLDGGVGNDVIVSTGDTVLFRAGAGIDLVSLDTTSTIRFEDVASGSVTIVQDGSYLIIQAGSDALVIRNGGDPASRPGFVTFSDGVTWTGAALAGHAVVGSSAAVRDALPALEQVLADGPPQLPVVPVNLIVNGGFEDLTGASDAATWGYRNTNPAGVFAGWVNTGDTRAEVHRDIVGGVGATEGSYWFDLEGAPKNAKLVQTVAGIEQGETYQLKFSIADTDTAQASDTIKVAWGNQVIYTGVPKTSWQTITIDVVGGAGDGSNKLTFESVTANANGAGVALDDVSMIKLDVNPNLIVNGSFEDLTGANDPVSSWGYRNTSPNGVIPGWKQTDLTAGGRAELHYDTLNGVSALDGRIWFDMDGNKNNARLVQSVAGVEAGATYELTFSIADIDGATNDDGIRVSWGGTVVYEGVPGAAWETVALRVVGGAGDGQNQLVFQGTETNLNGYGAALDAVSLRKLPSPTEGDDVLTGTAGADAIDGLGGADTINGLAGADILTGGAGDDVLNGGEGNDTLTGGLGKDRLNGGAGDDRLIGDAGDDTLFGGAGLDTADYATDTAGTMVDLARGVATGAAIGHDELTGIEIVIGGSGADILVGDSGANRLEGRAGNDVIEGGAGDDVIVGGEGSDTLVLSGATGGIRLDLAAGTASGAGLGTDIFSGIEAFRFGSGDDRVTLVAGAGQVGPIDGGAGDDTLVLTGTGTLGALAAVEHLVLQGDWMVAGTGADVSFQTGAQTLGIDVAFAGTISGFGQEDRIQLLGIGATDAVLGAGNVLTISGGQGAPLTLHLDLADDYAGMDFALEADGHGGAYLSYAPGHPGNDAYAGSNGNDVYDGGSGNDTLFGRAGNDMLSGGTGTDQIDGGSGIDRISGGAGDDVLKGGSGADTIAGGSGNDAIDGGSEADIITGDAGNDTIQGGSGADIITGGAGNDVLSGGSGADSFVFATGFGHDTITDFGSGDVIAFDPGIFADFGAVVAAADQVGGDVVVTVDAETSLTLSHVALASLTADDFRFAA